jgi:hypothetical protein
MAILLFKFDQLVTLPVPELAVQFAVVGAFTFPSKPDFVQQILSIL